jgi:hypothetical protein
MALPVNASREVYTGRPPDMANATAKDGVDTGIT